LGLISETIFIPLYFVYAISFFINAVITLTVVRYFAQKYNEKITGQF